MKLFHHNQYVTYKYHISYNDYYVKKEIKEYGNKFYTKGEVDVLNQLTEKYCDVISAEPLLSYGDNPKTTSYIRFIFMSSTFSILQELVYMPDGSKFDYPTGEIVSLGDNWYYHYSV